MIFIYLSVIKNCLPTKKPAGKNSKAFPKKKHLPPQCVAAIANTKKNGLRLWFQGLCLSDLHQTVLIRTIPYFWKKHIHHNKISHLNTSRLEKYLLSTFGSITTWWDGSNFRHRPPCHVFNTYWRCFLDSGCGTATTAWEDRGGCPVIPSGGR